jgi:hypothetical protein
LQSLHLDKLEETFRDKALVDRDVASGVCVFIGQSPAFEGIFANARKPAPRRAW